MEMEHNPSQALENRSFISMDMEQDPSQTLIFDFVGDLHQQHSHRLHPQEEEVNVYLCLTCGFPVFTDEDDDQESDLTSPFCLDCFTMFHSRDSSDEGFHHDDPLKDMDDYDHEDRNDFYGGCIASSVCMEGHALQTSMGFGFTIGGNTAMRTS